jgi:Zn-dependent peptidase ImmA (M78 family)/energy-converting hydrogenase A subunit M
MKGVHMTDNSEFLNSIYALLENVQGLDIVELIKNKRDTLNLSDRDLSKILNLERRSLQRLLNGETQKVDILTFIKVSQFLEIDIKELIQLYVSKADISSIEEIENARLSTYLIKNFDLSGLQKNKIINTKTDFKVIEERLKQLFQLKSIYEYSNFNPIPLFSKTKRESSNQLLKFWVTTAFIIIKLIENDNEYDRGKLIQLIPKLKPLSRNINSGLHSVIKALYEVGVTVVFQSYLSGTQTRGATFIYKEKPYIIVTNFNKRYDTLWFALFHELYHVLKDFERIKSFGYHVTGEADLFIDQLTEDDADKFARDILISEDRLNLIKEMIDIPGIVEEYSEKWNIHSSIIYGQYLRKWGTDKEYSKYQRYLHKTQKAVENILVVPWEAQSVNEISQKVNNIFNNKLKVTSNE